MNEDESEKCYEISQNFFKNGNVLQALRFAEKCYRMEPSKKNEEWLSKVKSSTTSSSNTTQEKTNTVEGGRDGKSHLRNRKAEAENKNAKAERTYTNEQVKMIKEICSHREKGDLYSVLGLQRNCDASDVKKAYRKLALQFHPDRCSAPNADDAFKAISFSFSVLSDEKRRRAYDLNGIRSTDRTGSQGSYSQQGTTGYGSRDGVSFDDNSYEAARFIFDTFFGGGFSGMPMSAQFAFGPGVFAPRASMFTSYNQYRNYSTHPDARSRVGTRDAFRVIIIALFVLITMIGPVLRNMFSARSPPDYNFYPSSYYNQKQTTNNYQVDYWVNAAEWSQWLKYLNINQNIQTSTNEDGYRRKHWKLGISLPAKLSGFEDDVVSNYMTILNIRCSDESDRKRYVISKTKGWFHTDKKKLAEAESIILPSCDALRKLRNKIKHHT